MLAKIFLFFALFAIALAFSFAPHRKISKRVARDGTCSSQDSVTTVACLQTYYTAFGFDSSKLPDFIDYFHAYELIFNQFGAQGVDIICNYETDLQDCLGGLIDTYCLRPESFQTLLGLDMEESYLYSEDIQSRRFECNNAQLMKDHIGCFKDVVENHLDGLAACLTDYENDVNAGTELCAASDKYTTCLMNLYSGLCGSSVASFICGIAQTDILFDSNSACSGKLQDCGAVTVPAH